jgi:hypothetical protein
VITLDRPGYGDSNVLPGLGLADVAADVVGGPMLVRTKAKARVGQAEEAWCR